MKILFLTDVHETDSPILQHVEEFKKLQPDLILIGGDFSLFTREEMDPNSPSFEQNLQKNEETISKILKMLSDIAPTKFVLGNHDFVGKVENAGYITEPTKFGDLIIVPQSGSSSTLLQTNAKIERDKTFWEGYPFGPFADEDLAQFVQLQERSLKQNSERIKNEETELEAPCDLRDTYNNRQYDELA